MCKLPSSVLPGLAEKLHHVRDKTHQAEPSVKAISDHYQRLLISFMMTKYGFDQETSKDLYQEVAMKMFTKTHTILNACQNDDKKCHNYVYQMFKNQAIDHLRQNKMPSMDIDNLTDQDFEQIGTSEHIDEDIDRIRCLQKILACLQTQNPKAAQAIKLLVNGESGKKIAETINHKPSAIQTYLYECRKKLKALWDEHCPDVPRY